MYRAILAVVALAAPTLVAQEYILQVPPERYAGILAKYGLRVLDRIPNQNVYRVTGAAGKALDDDDRGDEGLSLEPNQSVGLSELSSNPAKLIQTQTAAKSAISTKSYVNYYGDSVLAAYASQPALTKIRVKEVHASWALGTGIVAVIDTGIDPAHPALKRFLVNGYDFTRNKAGMPNEMDDLDPNTKSIISPYTTAILESPADINPYTTAILESTSATKVAQTPLPKGFGHGTMVAGIVHLIAPSARIMPLKPFTADGKATLYNVIRAIYYAQLNGARVINMSLSFATDSPALETAIYFVSERQVVCVASTGNQGLETMAYPAAYDRVAGIGSVNDADVQSVFTNHGDNITLVAAPGEAIVTTFPGGKYAVGWGTSFAAPIVSGGVSLMIQVKFNLAWEWAKAALAEAAPVDGNLGSGRVDLARAVAKAAQF